MADPKDDAPLGPPATPCGEGTSAAGCYYAPPRAPRGDNLTQSHIQQLAQLASVRIRQIGGPSDIGRAIQRAQEATARRLRSGTTQFLRYLGYDNSAPWELRKKLGKSGALYTLGDVLQNVVRQRQRGNNAKVQAETKAGAARVASASTPIPPPAAIRRPAAVVPLRPGTLGGVAGAGNELISQMVDLYYQQKRLRERRQQRLRIGRRGASATRAFQPTAIPGRRGFLATRPFVPAPQSSAAKQRSGVRAAAAAASGVRGRRATIAQRLGVLSKDQASEGRRKMSGTRALPRVLTPTRSRFAGLARLLNPLALRLVTPTRVRTATRTTRTPTRSTPAEQARLTTLNTVGVGSLVAKETCGCDKPKKRSKSRSDCRNPIISRTVKDDVVTTKRKLLCPPSKPK